MSPPSSTYTSPVSPHPSSSSQFPHLIIPSLHITVPVSPSKLLIYISVFLLHLVPNLVSLPCLSLSPRILAQPVIVSLSPLHFNQAFPLLLHLAWMPPGGVWEHRKDIIPALFLCPVPLWPFTIRRSNCRGDSSLARTPPDWSMCSSERIFRDLSWQTLTCFYWACVNWDFSEFYSLAKFGQMFTGNSQRYVPATKATPKANFKSFLKSID